MAWTHWTPEDTERFLRALRVYGVVSFACRAVKVPRSTAYLRREQDDAFRSAWDEAVEESTERMEREAVRRARLGTVRPVFYRGEEVGGIREFSDTLLQFMLKARKPEVYREKLAEAPAPDPSSEPVVEVVLTEDGPTEH